MEQKIQLLLGYKGFFRSEADDEFSGDKSFLYGKSSANQVNSSEGSREVAFLILMLWAPT